MGEPEASTTGARSFSVVRVGPRPLLFGTLVSRSVAASAVVAVVVDEAVVGVLLLASLTGVTSAAHAALTNAIAIAMHNRASHSVFPSPAAVL